MKQLLLLALFTTWLPSAFAQEEEDDYTPPPAAESQATWLYSWTNNPSASADAKGYVASRLLRARECVKKINAAEKAGNFEEVAGCEGDGMAAGPGIYVCDNPFTSHDYGDTLLILKAKAGNRKVANMSGLIRPADGGPGREVTGNPNYDAVFYDFRANDFGGYALAVREPGALDLTETVSMKIPVGERKPFRSHAPFACASDTPLPQVLAHWGDQLEFLSLTFSSRRDPSGKSFEKAGGLNEAGFIAALASEIASVPEAELRAKIEILKSLSPAIKEALGKDACAEVQHISPRACLAHGLYSSMIGDKGSDRNPTHAWPFSALKPALVKLGVLDAAAAAKLANPKALASFLAKRFAQDPSQARRAEEAFGCMKAVKSALATKSFATWAAPESRGDSLAGPAAEAAGGSATAGGATAR